MSKFDMAGYLVELHMPIQGACKERPDHVDLHGGKVVHLDSHGALQSLESIVYLLLANKADRFDEILDLQSISKVQNSRK